MAHALWHSDPDGARSAFLAGEPAEVMQSEYGANEHLFDFLRERGWWEHLTAFRPAVKPNGKAPQALNGAWAMVNLAHLGHLQHADPLLRDGWLMREAGFTLREVQRAQKLEQGVADRDTLRNHCKRITLAESRRVLYGSVAWLRQQKGLRGHWYAVDSTRIAVVGKAYEGAGRVWDEDEGWIRGYKLLAVLNVTRGRERIVGLSMGPVQMDDRELLREALRDMRAHGLEPAALMHGLILDRGFWGAEFLGELQETYGLHWCIIVPSYVRELHAEVARLVQSGDIPLTPRVATYRSGRQEKLRIGSYEGLVTVGEHGKELTLNVVLARRVDEQTGEVQERLFATNLPLTRLKPLQVVEKYSERWAIENEGFREFSQRWRARVPIGRCYQAIYAQLTMLALCYNAMKDYAMKKPKEAETLQRECRRRARRSYLAGAVVLVFIPRRRIYAVMNGREVAELSQERKLRRVEYLIASGISPPEAIARARAEGL